MLKKQKITTIGFAVSRLCHDTDKSWPHHRFWIIKRNASTIRIHFGARLSSTAREHDDTLYLWNQQRGKHQRPADCVLMPGHVDSVLLSTASRLSLVSHFVMFLCILAMDWIFTLRWSMEICLSSSIRVNTGFISLYFHPVAFSKNSGHREYNEIASTV